MDEQPTHLDLFSGIGGFALAAQWAGFRTVAFCEIDKYCQKVLAQNFLADPECSTIATKDNERRIDCEEQINCSGRPRLFGSIFDLDGRQFKGVDLITGGFPCQPFSVAGKRRGKEDNRAIWPQMFRVISEARPAWVLGENVPGIIGMELDNVLSDLEGIGYATRSFVIPACAVDARHRRDRLWILANSINHSNRTWRESDTETDGVPGVNREALCRGMPGGTSPELADTNCKHGKELQRWNQLEEEIGETASGWRNERTGRVWLPEPDVGRVAHGIPNRVDRLKGLGNAIVPQVAYQILKEIRKLC